MVKIQFIHTDSYMMSIFFLISEMNFIFWEGALSKKKSGLDNCSKNIMMKSNDKKKKNRKKA